MQIAVLISVQPDGGTIKPYVTVAVSVAEAVDCAWQILRDARIDFSAITGTELTGQNVNVYA